MNIKAVHEKLVATARDQDTVTYGELIPLGGLSHFTGDALSGALGRLLYDVVMVEIKENPDAPMLSAVAVSSSDNAPSKGFYELAREMGRLHTNNPDSELAFWMKELKACYNYWQAT